jgi:hypothetical protein
MRRLAALGLAVALTFTLAGSLQAQNTYQGLNLYVTGPSPEFDNWTPGTPAFQLRDDGTNGDVTLGDKIFSLDYTPSTVTASPGALTQWKAASAAPNAWSIQVPGGNCGASLTTGVVTKLLIDTNPKNDGFKPDPDGATVFGFAYTQPSPVASVTTYVVVAGDFLSQVGGVNWAPDNLAGQLFDDGSNGDVTAGDKIYTRTFTGISAGGYNFKVTFNGSWGFPAVSTEGFFSPGGNIPMTVLATSDVITIRLNANTGRYSIQNSNPDAQPGPPFYAVSSNWSTALDAGTQLYDDATHGDVTLGDGIYSRVFVVSTPTVSGAPGTVQVKQKVGPQYPDSGGYPFNQITTGGAVLVQFDTNTRSDGYEPGTRIVWTDPATRVVPGYLQAVGDFQIGMGAANDWDNNNTLFRLYDDATHGDATSGDGIFTGDFGAVPAGPGLAYKQVKGISPQGSWEFQLGGPGEGYTRNGSNTALRFTVASGANLTVKVDAITGRIAVGTGNPIRPPSLNASSTTSASDWALY